MACGSWRRAFLNCFCICMLLGGARVTSGAVAPPHPPVSAAAVDSLRAAPARAALLALDLWTGLRLQLDRNDGRLAGELAVYEDWLVLGREGIAEGSRLVVSTGPLMRLERLAVEVLPPDGQVRRLGHDDLPWSEQTIGEDQMIFADRKVAWTILPGIERGSRVRVEQQYKLQSLHGVPPMQLGTSRAPWLRSALTLDLPQGYDTADTVIACPHHGGAVRSKASSPGKWRRLEWNTGPGQRSTESPISLPTVHVAIRAMPGATPLNSFAIGKGWAEIGAAYRRRSEPRCAPTPELRTATQAAIAGATGQYERIERVHGFVREHFHYLGLFDAYTEVLPQPAAEVLRAGFGDCKGLSALTVGLLRAAGVDAELVLVATGARTTFADGLANLAQFDHCIVLADDGADGVWIDPTTRDFPVGTLPAGDLFWPALVLREIAPGLERPAGRASDPGRTRIQVDGAIDTAGIISMELEVRWEGAAAVPVRALFEAIPGASREHDFVSALLVEENGPVSISRFEFVPQREVDHEAQLSASVRFTRPIPQTREALFLTTQLVAGAIPRTVPLAAERGFVLSQPSVEEIWSWQLPSGMRLQAAPDVDVRAGQASYYREARQVETLLSLRRAWRLRDPADPTAPVDPAVQVASRARAQEAAPLRLVR